jgi:hypothetical protein
MARLAYSFPVFDRLARYKLSTFENPRLIARLGLLRQAGLLRVLAVDLARQEVVVGFMAREGPASRAMIGGRMVTVPRQ